MGVGHFLSAILTPLIGGIVAYIAWQQFTVNRRQHRLALFEKRLAIYNFTMKMLATAMRSADPTHEEGFQFMRDTRDHEFLFGPEVTKFLNDIYSKAVKLHAHQAENNPETALQRTELMTWFEGQMGEARKVFLPYLDFRKP